MNKEPTISHIQLRGLIVSTIFGVGVLSMQNPLAENMGPDGWIAILITGILLIPIYAVYNKIFKLYPGKDIFQIGRTTLGRFIFTIMQLVYLAYLILLMGIVARNLGELVKIFLLQTTPIEVIILTFIIATTYIACCEIDVIVRLSYILYPVTLVFALIIVLIALPGADFTRMLPAFQFDLPSLLKSIKEAYFSFIGIEMALFALPYVEKKDKTMKSGVIGITTITVMYILLYIMTISHFSIEQVTSQNYPLLNLIRQLDLQGFFLENLDGLVMALWVLVVFSSMAPLYYASGKILSNVFKTKKHKKFIIGLVPVIYYVAMKPANFIELLVNMRKYVDPLSYISIILIPLLILIVGAIKKKVQRNES